jgi:hypothetical protein
VGGGGCRESEHDRGDDSELVVEMAGFIDRASLERDLETTTTHTEAHGIHMDLIVGSAKGGAFVDGGDVACSV